MTTQSLSLTRLQTDGVELQSQTAVVVAHLADWYACLYHYSGSILWPLLPELSKIVEFFMYVVLGIAWIIPVKFVFMGIGQEEPDARNEKGGPN